MARGMWIYHTLAYAIKEGTRYTIVHGANCDPKVNTSNNCQVTVGQIAQVIQNAGIGLEPASLQVRMQSNADDTGMTALSSLLTNNAIFPTNPGNLAQNPITFTGQYPFLSAISMFWPGAGSGVNFQNLTCNGAGTYCLPATSQENVQF
jgi:outer membrane protein W